MKRLALALVILAVAGISTAAAGYRWVADPGSSSGEPIEVLVPPGSSGIEIAEQLEQLGIISSATAFRIYAKVSGMPGVQAGRYRLRKQMAHEDLATALTAGPFTEFVKLVIPEGLNVEQVAAQVEKLTHISAGDFLAKALPSTVRPGILPQGTETLEGFLYPATYYVEKTETAESLVKRLVAQFEKVAADVSLDEAGSVGRTPYEVLIIASMIEEEVKTKPGSETDERTKISAVIHNRLRKGIPLGIDATIQYAVKKYRGEPLTQSDLDIDSPFNTRKRQGLPPNPISSPRAASIEAAMNPAQVDLLYYVLSGDCVHHVFTANYDEFLRAKDAQPRSC